MTDKHYLKIWREIKHYDGHRDDAIQRDGGKCVRCGKTGDLAVHHKDFKGRGYKGKVNNDLSNLETLCNGCHRKAHAKRGKYLLMVAQLWDKPDREIARLIGLSHPTIKEIRKAIAKKLLIGGGPIYKVSR